MSTSATATLTIDDCVIEPLVEGPSFMATPNDQAELRESDAELQPIHSGLLIPSDSMDFSTVDGSDPVAVRAALTKCAFGDILLEGGIEAFCLQGMGQVLLPNTIPAQFDTALIETVDPRIGELEAETDLTMLAILIIVESVTATDERRAALIKSTAKVEIFGALAQAMLTVPEKTKKRGWPWWYKPRRRAAPNIMPNLFGEG